MIANHHIWRVWAKNLHRWGLKDLAAAFLEAAGPLTIVGAQAVYVSQPFFNNMVPGGHWQALAELLEDRSQREAFVAVLREESPE